MTNFLSDENVQRRASAAARRVSTATDSGILSLLPPRVYPGSDFRPEVRVAEYKFGPVPFGLENARDPSSVGKTVVEMGGTALDKEDILYLSKVCEMAREILPRPWNNDQALIKDLRLASKHLDTLNEIWWLGRWSGLTDLRREVTILESSSKTVDWSFKVGLSESWTINLEVKRLIGSLGARVYGKDHHFYTAVAVDGSPNKDDPRRKFRSSLDHEINVLAATWFDEISADLGEEGFSNFSMKMTESMRSYYGLRGIGDGADGCSISRVFEKSRRGDVSSLPCSKNLTKKITAESSPSRFHERFSRFVKKWNL